MSNLSPSAPRPKPRPTSGTARGRARVPGPLDPAPEPSAVAALADHHEVGGRLPVSELLFHRAGAASPFGDDLQFPLPAGALTYRHG
jgi:succinate dehydrogenase / fumarate reductase, iron-sulfur subunit